MENPVLERFVAFAGIISQTGDVPSDFDLEALYGALVSEHAKHLKICFEYRMVRADCYSKAEAPKGFVTDSALDRAMVEQLGPQFMEDYKNAHQLCTALEMYTKFVLYFLK